MKAGAGLTLEETAAGAQDADGREKIGYSNLLRSGIITTQFGASAREGLGNFRSLSNYLSEVSKYKPQEGTMVNTPAVIVGEYGNGRVLCISPHPESTDDLNRLVQNAVRWTARRK